MIGRALTAYALALLAVGLPYAPPSAAAQQAAPDRPAMVPTREASVLYRMSKAGVEPVEARITTKAGGSPMRLDMPDGTYMLVDQAARSMAMVVPDEQTVLELPFEDGPQAQFQLNERMRFTRKGVDTVAAVRCTNWEVTLDRARGTMCISDDGIMLRSLGQDEAGRRNSVEAISVSFAPAPASDFTPPSDFDRMIATPNGPVPAPVAVPAPAQPAAPAQGPASPQ